MRILMINDNPRQDARLRSHLVKRDFVVYIQGTIPQAVINLSELLFDVVILWVSASVDASKLVSSLRLEWRTVPIVVLKNTSSVIERIATFKNGADEFLSQHIDFDELVERIWSIHRRGSAVREFLHFNDLSFDPRNRQGWVNQRPFVVSRREAALLEMLIANPGQPILREVLQKGVYSVHDGIGSNALAVLVHKIRRLLASLNSQAYIGTIPGHGYALCLQDTPADQTEALLNILPRGRSQ
jgi:DNA-binding response OmpR family regulator